MQIKASFRIAGAREDTFEAIVNQDTTQSQQQFQSGKLSRRAKAAQRRTSTQAPEVTTIDTSRAVLDYIRSLPRDSSARIAQFTHVRKDQLIADGKYYKTHSLFLSEPSIVKYQAVLDSSKWVYRLRRVVGDYDTRVPIEIPLEEYTTLRLQQNIRQNWEDRAQFYKLAAETKTGLGEVFGKVTKIEIPVPKNPLFSIFGPNIIRLNINGEVNIHGAFRNTKSDLYTASPLGQSRNEPDFKQEVQVNVKGEIGDKLKIDADWNTQRTFEYENQLKVRYQGYDDEIVQSVEAGNVSLPTSSSFISSSQALFGIKAKFQFGPLNLITVATQKKGQIKELSVSGGAQATQFQRRLNEYSKDHYFIDTSYIKIYEKVFRANPVTDDTMQTMQIQDIEVWVTRQGNVVPDKERNVVAFLRRSIVDSLLNLDPVSLRNARAQSYSSTGGELEAGVFVKLEPNIDYSFNKDAGIITMNRSVQQDQAIAVAYVVSDFSNNPVYVGQFGSNTPNDSLNLFMKLVRPKNLVNTWKAAWRHQLKNHYPLGGRGIKKEGFQLYIEYEIPGQTPLREVLQQNIGLLEMFGLDKYTGETSTNVPDKEFDYFPGVTIDESRGELIFQSVEPFRAENIKRFLLARGGFTEAEAIAAADSFKFEAVYDTSDIGATNDQRNRYFIRGSSTAAQRADYQLGFNIVEGSVEVTSDGQKLTPGVDYTVDYISGQVVIKNQMYLVPNKPIQIKYEANDLFQLASKSLLGARGDINVGKNSTLGFTVMNLNQQSLSDKVRLGEEPISNTILGIDGSTSLDAPWLTDVLNYLPGVKTNAVSQVTFRGELAYMSPDPNTRKSPIPQDGGKGIAYIDDFEGARQTIPLGVGYSMWKDASPPWYMPNLDSIQYGINDLDIPFSDDQIRSGKILADTTKIQYKARASWFNVLPSDVTVTEIWGIDQYGNSRKSVARGEELVTVFNFLFRPAERGAFNYSMNLENTIGLGDSTGNSHTKAWAGVQHILGMTSTNLIDQNIGFIELWVKVINKGGTNSKLNIDLGYISEAMIPGSPPAPLRYFHTEDGLDGGLPRGVLNPEYDWGLDGYENETEKSIYAGFIGKYSQYAGDPSGDNWVRPPYGSTNPDDYDRVNGTEGNSGAEIGLIPDTEDRNNNNVLDKVNAYFEYEIPLDTASPIFKKFVAGGGANGWYQVRLPLNDYNRRIGEPTMTNVEGVRLWVTNAQEPVLFRIAEFNLTGNQWEKLVKTDSSFEVSVVNYEDDPSYTPSPGVERQKDRTRPDENVYGNEQSLNLIVKNLGDSQNKEAIKWFKLRPLDMFDYRALKMFVHGELGNPIKRYDRFNYTDTSNYDAEVFVRFGDDSVNYYEYRAPVRPDWYGNDVLIKFSELTASKARRDTLKNISPPIPVPNGPAGATYRVRGNPRLDRILFISIGIENPDGKGDTVLNGELWANELRLIDVDDTPGMAYRFDTSIKFADVGNVAFTYSQRDPFFHALEDRFGTRNTNRNWNLSAGVSFDKFLPESWTGSSLNFNYTHSEAMSKPRYRPGTDILVEEEARAVASDTSSSSRRVYKDANDVRIQSEDLNITDSYAAPNIKFNVPLKTWLVTETINKMTLGYSYNNSRLRNPSIQYSEAWNWKADFRYSTPFSQKNYLVPFSFFGDFFLFSPWKNLKFYYTPKQLNFGASLNRSQTRSQARKQQTANPVGRNLAAQRSMSFSWQFFEGGLLNLGTDYQLDISSSLVHLETDSSKHQRPFSAILDDIFLSDHLIYFGIDQSYNQSINLSTKPVVPQILMLDKIIGNPTLRYSVRYSWTNNVAAGPLGRNAGWGSDFSYSFDFNLKPISEKIWSPTTTTTPAPASTDTVAGKKSTNVGKTLDQLTRVLFKTTIFDFDKFNFNFNQRNNVQNSGVLGGPGFTNLFNRVPFFQSSLVKNGPSLLYQLGISSDPHGDVVLKTKGTFPFITGYTVPGLRATGMLVNMFSQNNQISMQTSRPLLEGVQLQLNWKVGWSYNENQTIVTDSLGNIRSNSGNRSVSGDVERSFITLPPVLVFKFFKTSIEDVNKKYETLKLNQGDSRTDEAKLSQAFEEGFEALPWLTKILGKFAPRANWSIRWSGLEKYSLFNSFASSVSIGHSYSSNFKRRWKLTPVKDQISGENIMSEVTESQSITFGFTPLIEFNIGFKQLMKGNLNAAFRYGTSTSYDLSPSLQNVTEGSNSDYSITASYSRQGFEIPFFGLSLSNDIDINFNYTYSRNTRRLYDFKDFREEGTPMEGSKRTTMEPRLRYTLSARVNASLYYRYTKLSPDEGGSKIPGSTINEGGLDIRVAIQ